ncbi:TonB-dependent receptor [Sphingobacteriaceae bacterium WQ 2009]|uniref:TonB-dependent receptor n=1 Tax=Rhinopithecimicrobium faecis TaxID=2820698 RepID=A0A8T4H714_9SPHI|nr:TonB-dependent receptor [Sphingobacteriaceae bacterium WQ 2009]
MHFRKSVLLGITSLFPYLIHAQQEVRIKVVEAQASIPIHGASISINNKLYSTGVSGVTNVAVKNFPARMITSSMGYASDTTYIQSNEPLVVTLNPSAIQLQAVETSAVREQQIASIANLSGVALAENKDRSLAEALKNIAGVQVLQTGTKIGKPVVNGLFGNRIAIYSNGVKLESQQWGNDHAPEIDIQQAAEIKVIKGAASLRYGAEALAGVVLVNAIPFQQISSFSGNAGFSLATNGRAYQPYINVQGLTPLKGLKYRANLNYARSGNQQTPSYYLNNTAFENYNANLSLGYTHRRSSYELSYTQFYDQTGILSATHIGSISSFYERLAYGRPYESEDLGFSYSIQAPKQQVRHQTLKASFKQDFSSTSNLAISYAYQSNQRQEFDKRRAGRDELPSMDMVLKTHTVDALYNYSQDIHKFQAGAQLMSQVNNNVPGTFNTPLIPNYDSFNTGVFGIYSLNKQRARYEIGARYDFKHFDAAGINRLGASYGSNRNFHNVSANVGFAYHIDNHMDFKSNLGLAWRAPSAQELYSQNIHQSTARYERGNPDLIAEKGLKWVNSLEIQEGANAFKIDLYANYIKDYIYVSPAGEFVQNLAGTFPIWDFKQDDAFIAGLDIQAKVPLTAKLQYQANASAIYARNIILGQYLPLIPPFSLKHELRWSEQPQQGWLKAYHFLIGNEIYAKQFWTSAANELAAAPPAYALVQIGTGATKSIGKNNLEARLLVDNLLNSSYKSYTDLFRYYSHGIGRSIKLSINYAF